MTTRHFIIATAGHVDHGKSALVKALTGTDPDRLPEEKKRQISIDLGFAELNLTAPNGDKIHAGIVDVPGHEDFVRNMIAGVGSIDLALLVIAADDGWMPQTEEHLQILTYLGVQRAVIVLAKSDLGNVDNVTEEIQNQLREMVFARAPIVPTSVRTGAGLADLKSAIAAELAAMHSQRDYGKPRLFVDRVFTLRGIGTVVTGTLVGGQFRRGQNIIVQSNRLQARIRSLQSHGVEIDSAQPGMRTALNLSDLPIDQVKRGDVITVSDLALTSALIAQVEKSPRLQVKKPAGRPLKNGSSVYLHHGTSRVAARIILLEKSGLATGQRTIAHLKLATPIFAYAGDRFVLRDGSEQHTIAGGVVLYPDGGNHPEPNQLKLLSLRAAAPDDVNVFVRSEIALRGVVSTKTVLNKSHFSATDISEALMRLQRDNEIVLCKGIAAARDFWQGLRRQAIALIDNAHKQNPERTGLELTELRTALRDQPQNVFDALIAELCSNDFSQQGSAIARTSHRPSLPPKLVSAAENVWGALSAKRFDPPDRKAFSQDRHVQEALRFLIDQGEIVEISSEIVVLREAAEQMQNAVTELLAKHGSATASQVRQKIGTTRRIIIPFLEYLDRIGVTRRIGDERVLAKESAAAKLANAASAQQT